MYRAISPYQASFPMDVSSLPPVENLIATQRQIEKDLSLLMDSFDQLKGAVGNFTTSLRLLGSKPDGHEALVPLTTSVYVDAVLEEPDRVLIDVGTGYYIEQPVEDAKDYFKGKVAFLTAQLDQLQPILNEKKSMISVLTAAIQQKLGK